MGPAPSSNDGVLRSVQSQVNYIPIVIFCCPNILKNEPCHCGPNSHSEPIQLPSIDHLKEFMNKIGQFQQTKVAAPAFKTSSTSSNQVSSKHPSILLIPIGTMTRSNGNQRLTGNNLAKLSANIESQSKMASTGLNMPNNNYYNLVENYREGVPTT